MDVQVIAASNLTPPSSGYKTLFINTEDSNILSWMDSSGTVTRFTEGDADCCCEIAKEYADGILCALNKGMLSPSEFKSLVDAGFTINSSSTDDGAGNKTCTVTFGSVNVS
jgi:hypothetical protein